LGQFNNDTVTLQLSNLPTHRSISISFDLYILNSWDGNQVSWPEAFKAIGPEVKTSIVGPDIWQLTLDGNLLLRTTFSNWDLLGFRQAYPGAYPGGDYPARSGAVANNTLGYIQAQYPLDSTYHLTFSVDHTDPGLDLEFNAQGLQLAGDEGWGIDNVAVIVSP
jgi:hypothetical protein